MKNLTISFEFTDDLGLKGLEFVENETNLPSDSKLLKRLAICILKAVDLNPEEMSTHDLLVELGIKYKIP